MHKNRLCKNSDTGTLWHERIHIHMYALLKIMYVQIRLRIWFIVADATMARRNTLA